MKVSRKMTFTVSGNDIVQSGIDEDPSGLSSISGIQTTYGGGGNNRNVYNFGNKRLVVKGSFSNKSDTLQWSGNEGRSIIIEDGGTLTLGEEVVVQRGSASVTVAVATGRIIFTRDTYNPANVFYRGLTVNSGGTFNQFGGVLESSQSMLVLSGGNLKLRDATWKVWTTTGTNIIHISLRSDNVDIDGWIVESNNKASVNLEGNFIQFNRYQSLNCQYSIASDGDDVVRTITNPTLGKSLADVFIVSAESSAKGEGGYDIYAAKGVGNDMIVKVLAGTRSAGRVFHFVQFKPKFYTEGGTEVLGVRLYAVDTDNSKRSLIYAPDTKVYAPIFTTFAAVEKVDLLTGVWHSGGDANLNEFFLDDRLPIMLKFIHYLYNIIMTLHTDSKSEMSMPNFTMVSDTNITETSSTTVDAYTELNTPKKLYDYAKSHLVSNFAGQPTTYVKRDGEVIDARALNVVFDAGASSVFAVTLESITIKSSIFSGSIETTGSVTVRNGAVIQGHVLDSTANSYLTFRNVEHWWVYGTSSNRNTNTTPIADGVGVFRFMYVADVTYYVRVMVGRDVIFQDINPTGVGELIIELSVPGLLASISKEVSVTQDYAKAARDQTVNVATGSSGPTLPQIVAALPTVIQITAAVPSTAAIKAALPKVSEIAAAVPTLAQIVGGVPTSSEIAAAVPSVEEIAAGVPTLVQIKEGVPNLTQITTALPSTDDLVAALPTVLQITAAVPTIVEITAAVPTVDQIAAGVPTLTEITEAVPTIEEMKTELPTLAAISDAIPSKVIDALNSENIPTAAETVDAFLDTVHGKRTDGTSVLALSLGEHLYEFDSLSVIRLLLETIINGSTLSTHASLAPGVFPANSLGALLQSVLDNSRASNRQTKLESVP